jgi:hypothetical protein
MRIKWEKASDRKWLYLFEASKIGELEFLGSKLYKVACLNDEKLFEEATIDAAHKTAFIWIRNKVRELLVEMEAL